jgi:4-hydroxy-tetrahydrodipicolinate synthase
MHNMCQAALDGHREQAAAIDQDLRRLHETLFIESSPIPVKWALAEMGLIGEGIRLPLVPLSEASKEPVRQAMRAAGIDI